MNMENVRQTVVVQLGSAASTLAALFANCDILVKKVSFYNGASLAGSDTNFAQALLMNGATQVASASNKLTGGQGSLTAGQFKAGAVQAGLCLAGSSLTVVTSVGGTGALSSAALQIEYVRNANK